MDYLDTSYVVALAVETDANHEAALALERRVKDPVVSELVVVETYTYFSRVLALEAAGSTQDFEIIVEAMARYALRRSGARIVGMDADVLLEEAKQYAPRIRLKTLDLLHLLAARQIGAQRIVTLDEEYARRIREAGGELGLEAVAPDSPAVMHG